MGERKGLGLGKWEVLAIEQPHCSLVHLLRPWTLGSAESAQLKRDGPGSWDVAKLPESLQKVPSSWSLVLRSHHTTRVATWLRTVLGLPVDPSKNCTISCVLEILEVVNFHKVSQVLPAGWLGAAPVPSRVPAGSLPDPWSELYESAGLVDGQSSIHGLIRGLP